MSEIFIFTDERRPISLYHDLPIELYLVPVFPFPLSRILFPVQLGALETCTTDIYCVWLNCLT